MKHHSLAGFAAVSLLICGTVPGVAQKAPPAVVAADPAPALEKRFDIKLDGGTPAEEAVALIADKLKQPVNVIFTGDSAATPLPTLRLHQVTLPEFFAAVQAAGQIEANNGRSGYVFAPVDGAPNIYTFSVQAAAGANLANQVLVSPNFTVASSFPEGRSSFAEGSPTPPTPEKISLFFDLSTILNNKLTIEDITTAIRTAWTASDDGKEPPPEALKFHQETKLLIATGFPRRLDTVTNIVKLLQERTLPSKDDRQRELDAVQRQRDDAERQKDRERADAEEHYSRLAKKLEQTEKDKDDQIKDLRNRLAELEIELAKSGVKR